VTGEQLAALDNGIGNHGCRAERRPHAVMEFKPRNYEDDRFLSMRV
jgi:hypothetical protein